jgi:RHS repeat-associated protein
VLGYTGGVLSSTARLLYDGDALVAEYDGSGTLLRRFAHGSDAGADDPLLWFEGTSTSFASARHLYADPRGSIVLVGDSAGAAIARNTYDEYGIPGAGNVGRFQYTGQAWLPELGLYYYKARMYSPTLGRFLQVDPIGYEDQVNLYAYVGDDPVDGMDPTGAASTGSILNLGCSFSTGCSSSTGDLESLSSAHGEAAHEAKNTGTGRVVGGIVGAVAGVAVAGACDVGTDGACAVTNGYIVAGSVAVGSYVGNAAEETGDRIANALSAVHGNSHRSQRPTDVYYLLDRDTLAIQKIGITSDIEGGRYSNAYLARENVFYARQTRYQSRRPAAIDENLD